MKTIPLPPIFLITSVLTSLLCNVCNAQSSGDWTWISGDSSSNTTGVYGIKGTAGATNKPGNRDSHSAWVDASGNFWMFGGEDYGGSAYNDLWEYTATGKEWTWVKGSSTINNRGNYNPKFFGNSATTPGARFGQASWIDNSGNFFVFGGYGFDGNGNLKLLNDLWVLFKSNGEWAWIAGDSTGGSSGVYGTQGSASAGTKPGAREYASGWADPSGNVWIFGGYGYDISGNQGYLNDLWKVNPISGQWIWITGSSTNGGAAVYATKGAAAAGNTPGARGKQAGFSDASGNFWVFGGLDNSHNSHNDLWEYSSTSKQWAWVSGDITADNLGVYGTKGAFATTNKPGARSAQMGMADAGGHIWLFGGYGFAATATPGNLNDLWAYSPGLNQWTWVSGDNSVSPGAVYGTKGMMAATNKPSGRQFSAGAMDASGNIWIMGGGSPASADNNDLWEFNLLVPLPANTLELQGVSLAGKNELNWQTQDETGLTRFIVQRSVDGANFSEIGIVGAVGSGSNNYSFDDDQPPVAAGPVFYRIEAEFFTGPSEYSRIIVLTSGMNNTAPVVYPNPCRDGVNLRLSNTVLLGTPVKVVDLAGRLIKEVVITGQDQYIDLYFLGSGVYVLQLADGTPIRIIKH